MSALRSPLESAAGRMTARVPLVLSGPGLGVSLLGVTPLGRAASDAIAQVVPRAKKADFAANAAKLNGHRSSTGLPSARFPSWGGTASFRHRSARLAPGDPRAQQGDRAAPASKDSPASRGPADSGATIGAGRRANAELRRPPERLSERQVHSVRGVRDFGRRPE